MFFRPMIIYTYNGWSLPQNTPIPAFAFGYPLFEQAPSV